MSTNGVHSKKEPAKRSRKATPRASAAQLRAMRKYLKMTGYKFDPKRLAKIRSEWVD